MNAISREKLAGLSQRPPILCFLHLPRTGGTTINRMLKYAFGDRAVFHADLLDEFCGEAGLAAALAGHWPIDPAALLISGHYGVAHPLVLHSTRPVMIAAILRHPIERLVSLYDYIRGTPDHPEHAALSTLTLNQALDAVPEFAVHCHNAQLRTLFSATDRKGIMEALQRYPYLLGRMDALDPFGHRLLGLFGVMLGSPLPRSNERPVLRGVAPARTQADYAMALARLERDNQAELEFFGRLPPIFASRPKPALTEQTAA
jgi:hypothetical protein